MNGVEVRMARTKTIFAYLFQCRGKVFTLDFSFNLKQLDFLKMSFVGLCIITKQIQIRAPPLQGPAYPEESYRVSRTLSA